MSTMQSVLIDLIRSFVGTPEYGAEIGVYKGETSVKLIEAFPTCYWHFVDPWCEWPKGTSYRKHKRTGDLSQQEWDKVYEEALARIHGASQKYHGIMNRATVHRNTSVEAHRLFDDHALVVVFIDGNHQYADVKADIEMWLPKIEKGGLICGHDYGGTYKGVKQAVDEIFSDRLVLTPGKRIWGVAL